ncbi:4-hydroxybenzoate 3-monooxygenase [Nocardia sp. alder85J]|uniref:4-hydroxybenzoate 3-monooxygenase n=1 Tax=Nocardia sp. alder85J TaxID=2862949 RepID=UPI001CD31AC7|nr:4-hydroxybenzoate 3-monooxygenase [Nocardia sp. alder85J]MCX4098079.1 4-hydroxybenzoate 3-monooxygenase [Nocardia sp. alder85J]
MRAEGSTHTTAVVILGAGPAGLVLGNLLRAAGVECIVLERRSRAHIEQRARAGFLAPDSVAVLREHGLDAGLRARGQTHSVCEFRSAAGRFELNYGELGRGEAHTVYPQQHLVTDLAAEYLRRGGDLRFEHTATAVHDRFGDRPEVLARDADGREHRVTARYLAGCDGARGLARQVVTVARTTNEYDITWLALLAQAPPTTATVVYGVHADGFAGQMPRSPDVTRYYLQCGPDDDPLRWSEQRIWSELSRRLGADRYGPLCEGAIIERSLVHLRSEILDPIQEGRLFLAGDSATSISPSAAKGANLAILGARDLAQALTLAVRDGDSSALDRYSIDFLPRILRAQQFSHTMIELLHPPVGPRAAFRRDLQRAQLHSLATSRSHRDFFAESYVDI